MRDDRVKRGGGAKRAVDRDTYERGCTGKWDYTSRNKAREGATRARKRMGGRFDAYHCHVCGRYHIGHTRKAKR